MSSSRTATTTTTSSTAVLHHHTYWCHECDMSILLPPTSTGPTPTHPPPRCPHCHTDFLEHMDSFTPLGSSSSSDSAAIWGTPHSSFNFPPLTANNPSAAASAALAAASDDNFLLNNPNLHRLAQLLNTNINGESVFLYQPLLTSRQLNSGASKRAVESLKTITIDKNFLEKDPSMLCPICKDLFCEDSEAKELPCKHFYHDHCITPWLAVNNTCPLCRFKLATEGDEVGVALPRRDWGVAERANGWLDWPNDVAERANSAETVPTGWALLNGGAETANSWPAWLNGEAERANSWPAWPNGVAERANSAETVFTSLPAWSFEGEREVGVVDDANAVRT